MQRRGALAVPMVVLATPGSLFAQPAARVYRIAILDEVSDAAFRETWSTFRDRLRELGYVEGRNVAFETRHAEGAPERLPALASELVSLKPDLIACAGTPATRAAIKATSIRRERVQALLIGSSATVVEFRDDIVKFAANEKLPAV